ncbi:MAG: amino acid adenylation domain-containing protein [Acidobacteriota bacterium]
MAESPAILAQARAPQAPAGERHATLVELLDRRAAEQPNHPLYTFLTEGEQEADRLTCGELAMRARAVAKRLDDAGMRHQRVLLLYPPGLEFIVGFFACLYAGAVAVPAYPPRSRRHLPRVARLVADAGVSTALTTSELLGRVGKLTAGVPELAGLMWLRSDAAAETDWQPPAVKAEDLAFLQYTSGSTSQPKGVLVSHANLLHNEETIRRAFDQSERSLVVGWLPLFHDMGLIGNVLQPLYTGSRCVLMSPMAFLSRPVRWLSAISRYRATTSGGPNFAYDLCCQKIGPKERQQLDLSSWQVAFNGAEPIRDATLERFASTFAECGFRRRAFFPCYGLAEATLFVTGAERAAPPRVAAVAAPELEAHRAQLEQLENEEATRRLVSSGAPLGVDELVIADPQDHHRLAPGSVGEIWVQGPAVAGGYWGQPEVSREVFGARLSDEPDAGPFLRTGDLGFMDAGELFVTGRLKEMIVFRGRNLYPQDIEASVESAHRALRPASSAAFSVEIEGREEVVVAAEIERRPGASMEALCEAVLAAVAELNGLRLHEVVLLRIATLPKTSSGKIQRRACAASYLAGELNVVGRSGVRGSETPADPGSARPADELTADAWGWSREDLVGLPEAERLAALLTLVQQEAARAARLPRARLAADTALTRQGIDSLAAVELQQRLQELVGRSLPLEILLEGASARDVARHLLQAEAVEDSPIVPGTVAGVDQPLTQGQRALWFLHRLAPETAAYHIAVAARARPALEPEALQRALAELTARHPSLRTTFHELEGEPVQRISPRLAPGFRIHDAREPSDSELLKRVEEEAFRPFDLTAGPLLRVGLWRRSCEETWVHLVVHHLVADFWSLAHLSEELEALYTSERDSSTERGESSILPGPSAITLADCAHWQRRRLESPRGVAEWDYWRRRLAPPLPVLELATDRPRPALRTFRGGACRARFGTSLRDAVERFRRAHDVTLFSALFAALAGVLRRHGGGDDLLLGTVDAGRGRPELDDVVGYLVNPLVLRLDLSGDPSFGELAARAQATATEAFAHGQMPFALLAERLPIAADGSRAPLFQVMMVLQNLERGDARGLGGLALGSEGARCEFAGSSLAALPLESGGSQLDLSLYLAEVDGELAATLEYNSDLFDATTAQRLLARFERLLGSAVERPERRVGDLPLLLAAEEHALRGPWQGEALRLPEANGLHDLFQARVARSREAVALVSEDPAGAPIALSFGELDRRAGLLARRLRRLGVGPEVRIGICQQRTAEMVISLLAVLEAGGAYVPLDPAYPRHRLNFMIEDSGAALVLGRRPAGEAPHRGRWLDPANQSSEAPPVGTPAPEAPGSVAPSNVAPSNVALVIYTSGSTGRPKGVAIEHRSLLALLHWARRAYGADELAGVLAATSINFDLSVFELFAPLCWGGKVILASDAVSLPRLTVADEVTLINTVPSAMSALVEAPLPPRLRTVNLAGEPLPAKLAHRLYEHAGVARLVNLYGPSEDTTYSTLAEIERGVERVTIGRPIAGTSAWVLDRHLRPLPPGVPGELFLAGHGLARGYLERPSLTAERFLPHPLAPTPGARLYRTGDLVRHGRDGRIEYVGRLDHQIKLRGFRIELGEVESVLRRHPATTAAAALLRDDLPGGRGLVAYVAPARAARDRELRDALRRRLPEYMVPSVYVGLEALPLSPNGKIDRRALPQPAIEPDGREDATTATEELIAGAFSELLGGVPVGREASFFALGGHSLLATRLVSQLRRLFGLELSVRTVFEAPTVAELAAIVERREHGEGSSPPILPRSGSAAALPLSAAQRQLWFLHELEPESPAYNMPASVDVRGPLDPAALAASLNEIASRHEILRTTVERVDGRPVQRIAPPRHRPLPVVDLSALPAAAQAEEAERWAQREAERAFDLGRGPLFRHQLLRRAADHHVVLINLHHLVADGWSLEVILQELSRVYSARVEGRPSQLPALEVQFADYALWQRRQLESEAFASDSAYWRSRLGPESPLGVPSRLMMPTDRPRRLDAPPASGTLEFDWPVELITELEKLGRAAGTTLYMTLLATFYVLLARYTRSRDVVVGTAIAGRTRQETEGLIGCFVNTLALRADLAGDPRFSELLTQVRELALAAYAHQDLPFEKLVEELVPDREPGQAPWIDVMLVLQKTAVDTRAFGGLELEPRALSNGRAKFDLTLDLAPAHGGLRGRATYNRQLFEAQTIERVLVHYRTLLAEVAANRERRLSELTLLSEAERRQLVAGPGTPYPKTSLVGLLEAAVRRSPAAPAVIWEETSLSFAELDARANQLARHLRLGNLAAEARVVVCLERSIELVVAVMAVLKAGGAYLPLEPTEPVERLRFILDDAKPLVVVTTDERARAFIDHGPRVVRIDGDAAAISSHGTEPLGLEIDPERLAYVIYTSGSTGRPKGVMAHHRGVVNYLSWVLEKLDVADLPWVSSIVFDASLKQVFGPLASGQPVRIVPEEVAAHPQQLLTALAAAQSLNCVPSLWQALVTSLEEGRGALPRRLRSLYVGGEELSMDLARRSRALLPDLEIVNLYGPTEATANAACDVVETAGRPTLGRPLANSRLLVLDRDLLLMPAGAIGELVIAGAGVTRGYLGRAALTAERFVPDSTGGEHESAAGRRLYKTGDLGRRRSDGRFDFLGRIDHQVKVRGFRVELGEIEAVLGEHPEVREAVVALKPIGGDGWQLVAYVVGGDETRGEADALRHWLEARLPSWMVPARLHWLELLPRTTTGKLDRAALPEPQELESPGVGSDVEPRSAVEEVLAGMMAEVLGQDEVGIHDSFFELGGHSLLATELIGMLQDAFEIELPILPVLYDSPTVASLSEFLLAEPERARQMEEVAPLLLELTEVGGGLDSP